MNELGRYVLVSTFPPRRDGIQRHTDQVARSRRAERAVVRLGLPGSTADHVFRLDGGLRPLRLLRTTRISDEIVLMWHPEFYITGRSWSRAIAYIALGTFLRARQVTVIVHEPDRLVGRKDGMHRRLLAVGERTAQRWCWRSKAQLAFHSHRERDDFEARFPRGLNTPPGLVVDHGAHFSPYSRLSRAEARRRLGVDADKAMFLCIGFLGRHKGFDRAIQAFRHIGLDAARLYIVGSPLYDRPEVTGYVRELQLLASSVSGVQLIERFVEGTEFDTWLSAADAVITPYRSAASSGVMARAKLLGTRVIASRAGGLPEQAGPGDIVIESDEQLA